MSRAPLPVRVTALALALLTLGTAPARAALFDDDEARRRIDATNQRITLVQKQVDERIAALETQLKSQGLVELFNQVELLKADVARLRGQFEVVAHELDEAQKRQRDLYVDLDTRLRKIEAGAHAPVADAAAAAGVAAPGTAPTTPAPAVPVAAVAPGVAGGTAAQAAGGTAPAAAAAKPAAATPDPAADQRAYDAALDLLKAGNYAGASTALGGFAKTYPKSTLVPSAQYWLGMAQAAKGDYKAALATQRQLVANYPDSPKVPDAMLGIASAQSELGDAAGARRTLNDIVAKYPKSDAAAKARARLGVR